MLRRVHVLRSVRNCCYFKKPCPRIDRIDADSSHVQAPRRCHLFNMHAFSHSILFWESFQTLESTNRCIHVVKRENVDIDFAVGCMLMLSIRASAMLYIYSYIISCLKPADSERHSRLCLLSNAYVAGTCVSSLAGHCGKFCSMCLLAQHGRQVLLQLHLFACAWQLVFLAVNLCSCPLCACMLTIPANRV